MSIEDYKRLSDNWLTENIIDSEYKKYKLLAFLKGVDEKYKKLKLYPPLADVIYHYQNLIALKENNDLISKGLSKDLKAIDLLKKELIFEKSFGDPEFMSELERILEFSIPELHDRVENGRELYDELESKIKLEPIGLSPLNQKEGYMLLNAYGDSFIHIYEYQISIFNDANSKYRGIHTRYLEKVRKRISNTFESVKLGLIRRYKKLPNPATFMVNSEVHAPLEETFLPISKRLMVQYVSI